MTPRLAGHSIPFEPGKPIGNVYYGTCSWTDRTLIDAGTFYPATAGDGPEIASASPEIGEARDPEASHFR